MAAGTRTGSGMADRTGARTRRPQGSPHRSARCRRSAGSCRWSRGRRRPDSVAELQASSAPAVLMVQRPCQLLAPRGERASEKSLETTSVALPRPAALAHQLFEHLVRLQRPPEIDRLSQGEIPREHSVSLQPFHKLAEERVARLLAVPPGQIGVLLGAPRRLEEQSEAEDLRVVREVE